MFRSPLRFVLTLLSILGGARLSAQPAAATPTPGPFFEAEQPFFQSQVQVTPPPAGRTSGGNFVVRGLIIRIGPAHAAVFDQELLRLAALWEVPAGAPLTTLQTMPQISYVQRGRRVNAAHPELTGPTLLATGMHPGVAGRDAADLFTDPRPEAREGEEGRGPLPESRARFSGVELAGETAVLHYRIGGVAVREWHDAHTAEGRTWLRRHVSVEAHAEPLHLAVGEGAWELVSSTHARSPLPGGRQRTVHLHGTGADLIERSGTLVVRMQGASAANVITLALTTAEEGSDPAFASPGAVAVPPAPPARRWPQTVTTPVEIGLTDTNGLVLDAMAMPEVNPWQRRVRAADVAFLSSDRAAVVTYEGDVWWVDGFGRNDGQTLTWQRYSSGLYEPLALVAADGLLVVATKNGLVRLHDRDGNGEADWFENFNDHLIQSRSTRAFALDLDRGPDGSFYLTQGGITTPSGIPSGGTGTAHTGAILRIAADGRTSQRFAAKAREPFVTVHPVTGEVTATDQQGHYTPSSVVYHVREGYEFGFPDKDPVRIDPPLTWIPHEQDPSSASQEWLMGDGMGPWNGRLLHLSYNTGRLLLIAPDFAAPVPQGAVIPLGVRTELPLLHARMHPRGDAAILAGFQIWGSRAPTHSGLVRLRPGQSPITTALGARSVRDGVILSFDAPLDPASLTPERVTVRLWNYRRSSAYGSGRFALDGESGTTPWGVAQVVPSSDRRSVFVHLPGLPAAMQIEVRHDFLRADGVPARGEAFFTVHQPAPADLVAAGFPAIDFSRQAAAIAQIKEPPPTIDAGRTVAETLGCIACHSIDGTTEGKVGPTWKDLYLAQRTFADGTTDVADEVYLREKILEPMKRRVSSAPVEMPSYRGVLSEAQLESVILYIKSLRRPPGRAP